MVEEGPTLLLAEPKALSGPHIWDRQVGEPHKWFIRFERFRLAGLMRSMLSVYMRELETALRPVGARVPRRAPSTWGPAAARWNWHARAEAWDEFLLEMDRQRWQARQREVRESDFQNAQPLRALAQQILDEAPKFIKATRKIIRGHPMKVVLEPTGEEVVLDPGTPEREIVTLALNIDLAIRALDLASRLQRLAANLPPPRVGLDLTSDGKSLKGYTVLANPDMWPDKENSVNAADSPI